MRSFPAIFAVRAILVLSVLLVASSCGMGSGARNPFDGSLEQGLEDRLRIQIQNMNFNDITVFAVSTGQRVRLGSVTGKTDGSFRLAWNYANPISFEINVIGGRGCDTPPITVDPGARIWVQIPIEVGVGQCRSGRA